MQDKTAVSTAMSLLKMCTILGFPKILQSDNGKEFVNQVINALTENSGIEHRLITAYHPQANGVAERYVQTAKRAIVKMTMGRNEDWDLYVPAIQYAINLKVTARHGSTPFSLMFARTPNGFSDFTATTDLTHNFDGEGYHKRLQQFTDTLYPAINERVAAYNKARIEQTNKERSFPIGAYVMAYNKLRRNKFEAAYKGPYKVLRRNTGGAYVLQDTDGNAMHRNFTPSELKLISHEPENESPSYEIDRIIEHTGQPGKYKYLVKWKGYRVSESTWEPEESFDDLNIITKYWDEYKRRTNKPQSPSTTKETTPASGLKQKQKTSVATPRTSLPRKAKRN